MSLLKRFFGPPSGQASTESTRPGAPSATPELSDLTLYVIGDGVAHPAEDVDRIVADANERFAAGHFGEALRLLRPTPDTSLEDPRLLFAWGSVLWDWGRVREAHAIYLKAEAKGMRRVDLLLQLGRGCLQLGSPQGAEEWMRKALGVAPDNGEAHRGLGIALQQQRRVDEAAQHFERALALQPDSAEYQIALGNFRIEQGNPAAAELCFRNAIALEEGSVAAWGHLGVALERQDRTADALEAFRHGASLENAISSDLDLFINLAISLRDSGHVLEAIALLEANLTERPSVHGFHTYGVALLTAGRLVEGWRFYQFRRLAEPLVSLRPGFQIPVWTGQDLHGKTILLHSEQGLGDVIQFARYAPRVKALGATVFMLTSQGLSSLARTVPGIDRNLCSGDTSPTPDFYIPMMSLPDVFGDDELSIPVSIPYLETTAERAERWVQRVGGTDGMPIGIAWAGSPAHATDRHRSLSLMAFASLGTVAGARFVSLQKGAREGEVDTAAGAWLSERLGPELEDLADAAAVIGALDLVISVDTALVHLAGALGKPVWVLLPAPADFRWMEEREDSPWYPTMRLFRQRVRGEWDEVIERVRVALEDVVRRGGAAALHGRPEPSAVPTKMPVNALPRHAPGHRRGMGAVVETRHGILQYLPDEEDIGDALGWYGEWLEGQRELLAGWLTPGSTVLEVGAGVGAHALWLGAALGAAGHLMLYEARAIHQRILRQNLAANRVPNVTLLRGSLGADDPADTLDGLQLERLDWLKCNEAATSDSVLAGGDETLWRLRPKVLAAVVDEAHLMKLARRVQAHGYRCWRIETKLYDPENFNRREGDLFGGRHVLSLLGVPEEADVRSALHEHAELQIDIP